MTHERHALDTTSDVALRQEGPDWSVEVHDRVGRHTYYFRSKGVAEAFYAALIARFAIR